MDEVDEENMDNEMVALASGVEDVMIPGNDNSYIVEIFFDISTGFRFSKISVECSVYLCSCPCLN